MTETDRRPTNSPTCRTGRSWKAPGPRAGADKQDQGLASQEQRKGVQEIQARDPRRARQEPRRPARHTDGSSGPFRAPASGHLRDACDLRHRCAALHHIGFEAQRPGPRRAGYGDQGPRREGPRAVEGDEATTQDFVFVNEPGFPFKDALDYSRGGMRSARLLSYTPDRLMMAGSFFLHGAERVLKLFGGKLPFKLALFAEPKTHTLGETFYTAAPMRYGKYVAKLRVAPLSKSVTELKGVKVGGMPMPIKMRSSTFSAPTAPNTSCPRSYAPTWRRCRSRTPATSGPRTNRRTSQSPRSHIPPRIRTAPSAAFRRRRAVLQLVARDGRPPTAGLDKPAQERRLRSLEQVPARKKQCRGKGAAARRRHTGLTRFLPI